MKLGTYELGPGGKNEGIYTGDARELAQAIPDESVDLVLTDPPFGIGFKYASGYQDDPKEYPDLVRWIVAESNRVIKPGGLCFVYVAQLRLRNVWPLFPEDSRIFAACKNFVQMRPTAVQYSYDPVIFWQKPGDEVSGHTGRDWHIGNTSPSAFQGMNRAKFHSCPRPLNTILYLIEHHSALGSIVHDPFLGSGTTTVAAKMLGRRYLAFEIMPDVAKLARDRVRQTQPPLSGLVLETQMVFEMSTDASS